MKSSGKRLMFRVTCFESFRRNAVELGQVLVEHHLLGSDEIDTLGDALVGESQKNRRNTPGRRLNR